MNRSPAAVASLGDEASACVGQQPFRRAALRAAANVERRTHEER